MLPREKLKYSLEEYLELDHQSEEKIEFWNGHIFTLSGVSEEHGQIEVNLSTSLTVNFRQKKKKCRVFPSNIRLKVPSYLPYRYPDLSGLCGQAKFEKLGKQDLLVNPQLIVEILSDSTESFDRGDKFTYYKSIESFSEYILIAQLRPHLTQYVKQSDNSWSYKEINGLNDKIYFASVDYQMSLAQIYEEVEFPPNIFPFRIIE